MFKLELDLHLYYVPPMEEHGGAIVLTRSVELPFVPCKEIGIHSREFEDMGSEPMGFMLKDLTWDIDRQVFLAHTVLVAHDTPWPFIVGDIQGWIAKGWRLGSYVDAYQENEEGEPSNQAATKVRRRTKNWPDDEIMETWPSLPPRSRSKHFNRTFGMMTRLLAETHNAESLAYAMHKTQMYFTEEQLKKDGTPAKDRFREARDHFYTQPFKNQTRSINRILAQYPSLKDVLGE